MSAVVFHLWLRLDALELPLGWRLFWVAALLILTAAARLPWLGLPVFVLLAYLTPRYGGVMNGMLAAGVVNWACLLTLSGWMLALLRGAVHPRPRDGLTAWMVAFVAWLGISYLAALALEGPYPLYARHHPLQYLQGLLLFLLAARYLGDRVVALLFSVTAVASLLLRGVIQGAGGLYLEGDVAPLAVMLMPVALIGARSAGPAWLRWMLVGSVAGLFLLLVLSNNRGGAVAFVVLALVLGWQFRRYWRYLLTALILVLVVLMALQPKAYLARFQAIWDAGLVDSAAKLDRATVAERLSLWRAAIELAGDNPLLGIGPGNFPNLVDQMRGTQGTELIVHNSYINALVEAGIPGLLLYLVLIVLALRRLTVLRAAMPGTWHAISAGLLIASLSAYLAAGLFISRQDLPLAYLLIGWAAALGASAGGAARSAEGLQARPTK